MRTLKEAKKWLVLNCPLCAFRFPLRKFAGTLKPILFPLGFASSRGRARGFATVERLPWSALPSLQNTEEWNSILNLYERLATAYDQFHQTCGFLSPRMKVLLSQPSYATVYRPNPLEDYSTIYGVADTANDVVDAYADDDILGAYSASVFLASGRCEI